MYVDSESGGKMNLFSSEGVVERRVSVQASAVTSTTSSTPPIHSHANNWCLGEADLSVKVKNKSGCDSKIILNSRFRFILFTDDQVKLPFTS